MAKKSKSRRILAKWHQRLGLISALVVLLLSITGLFLNHGEALNLDKKFMSSDALLAFYRLPDPVVHSIRIDDIWVSEANARMYINQNYVSDCGGGLRGAVAQAGFLLVACAEQLVLFSANGAVIETLDGAMGVPIPIQVMARCAEQACLDAAGQRYLVDVAALSWRKAAANEGDAAVLAAILTPPFLEPPEELSSLLKKDLRANLISMERFILDIHAGRFLGSLGPLIMDVFALMFIVLAITGVVMSSARSSNKSS
jgi:hypothetical protein